MLLQRKKKPNIYELDSMLQEIKTSLNKVHDDINSKSSVERYDAMAQFTSSKFENKQFIDRLRAVTGLSEETLIKYKNFNTFFENSQDKDDYKLPIVDLCRVERAYYFGDTLLHRRKRIFLEKAFNEGYYLESQNQSTKAYIEKRLAYNELITEKKCWDL
jgi:hypothetical protein